MARSSGGAGLYSAVVERHNLALRASTRASRCVTQAKAASVPATTSAVGSVAFESVGGRPHPVVRHVQATCQRLPPLRRRERLTPIVRHAEDLAIAELGDRDVAVHPAVPIVSAPFHDDGVATDVPPPHPKPQSHKVSFHLADARPPVDALAALGPLAHGILGQWDPEDALEAGLVSSLVGHVVSPS